MVKSKIIGWNFRRGTSRTFSANGSSSLEVLTSEKSRLEKRLVDIQKQIAQIKHSIGVVQNDIKWLNSLSNHQRRQWEKEHGKSIEEALRTMTNKVNDLTARISSFTQEKSRIPSQLASIQQQLDVLVEGEATGLEQGLDSDTAKELGELALEKEREKMEHERAIREAELEQQRLAAEQKQGGNQSKVWVVIGILALLAIAGYIIYKKKFATKITTG